MESQAIESIDELNDNTTSPKHPHCIIAWFTIALLLATWLSLFLVISFFWKKNNHFLARYETRFTQIQEQLFQNQTKYQELQKSVIQIQNFIQKKLSSNAAQIQISNIHQLIQQAQEDLLYLHDLNSALAALKLANKRLTELPSLSIPKSLHSLLIQNITSLKALPQLDISNALAQLNVLQAQVIQLPLTNTIPILNKETANNTTPATHLGKKWLSAFQSILHHLQQLIVIRHLDKPIEHLLPKAQQQYLQHNLQLLLQQAQWALLQRQQTIYQNNLQQIKEAIQQHFLATSSPAQTVIQTINELEKINLQPILPDLTPTLAAIASFEKTIPNTDQ